MFNGMLPYTLTVNCRGYKMKQIKKALATIITVSTMSLMGCGMAGNYNPTLDGSNVGAFFKTNNAEFGYLYRTFKSANTFTTEQVKQLTKSRLTIEAIIEYIAKLQLEGGVSYQDFKSQFGLAVTEYYKIRTILDVEILKFEAEEPGIIYWNMAERADYFVSACNKIINTAEDDIDANGMENLEKYGKAFFEALGPIIDMAL